MAPDPYIDLMLAMHEDISKQEACGAYIISHDGTWKHVKISTMIGTTIDPGDLRRVEIYDRQGNHIETLDEDDQGEWEFTVWDAEFLETRERGVEDSDGRAVKLVVGDG